MKSMESLKSMLCDELEQIAKKGDVSHTDLDNVYKLTESIKNIMKIDDMDTEGASARGYRSRSYDDGSYRGRSYGDDMASYDGEWRATGSYGDGDMSGARRGQHYVRGHYSYDGGSMLEEKINEMLEDNRLSLDDKSTLKRAMSILRK